MVEIYEKIPELIQSNSKLAIATVVHTSGSTPREVGAKMVVLPNGTSEGTIGGGKLEKLIIEDAKDALNNGLSTLKKYNLRSQDDSGIGMACGGEVTVFIEVIKKGNLLLIFGGGHIGLALYKIALETGFSIVIVDDRPEFVTKERFPKAEGLLNCNVDDPMIPKLVDKNTYIVIVTHEHNQDKLALKSLINLDYKYLGMIGSKRKVEKTLEELKNEGIPKDKLNEIYSPIGLDIKAETPAEIAVSILAELIYIKNTGLRPEHSLANKL